ncbi:MAG TPA: signal peptidase I [Gammaproteobacteria bacterium]|jgi:signal peptidase I|nr:signal peptidase I [Gammaproteobacteria bacterium]
MSINFPLVLVLATAFTGVVWLVDYLVFRPKRLGRAAAAGDIDEESRKAILAEPIIVEYSISFFPVLAIVLVLRSFLFEPFQIPTGSMIPTLAVGDFILVNKFSYGVRLPVVGTKIVDIAEPKNGEVMVFIPPHQDVYFIKRVVGIPGDTVRYQDKALYINGKRQNQTFVAQIPPVNPKVLQYREKLGNVEHLIQRNPYRETSVDEWVIPEGHYFMMGDNRDQSSDSRYWGLVSEHNIVGRAVAIWLHKKPGLRLPEFSRNGWIQ